MNATIYILGSVEFVADALNAIAMLFAPGGGWIGTGVIGLGAVIVVYALVSLFNVLVQSAMQARLEVHHVLIGLVVYLALFGVKMTVLVEDVYSGEVQAVDNVPVGVAAPAWILSGTMYFVSESFATVFQDEANEQVSLSTKGFVYPLRVLMGVRNINPASMGPNALKTWMEFDKYCFRKRMARENGDWTEYYNGTSGWEKWIEFGSGGTYATLYNEENPGGTAASCDEIAVWIEERMNRFITEPADEFDGTGVGTLANNILASTTALDENTNVTGQEILTQTLDVFNLQSGVNAQYFVQSRFLANMDNLGEAYTAGDVGATMAMTQAREQLASDSAGIGSGFLNFAFWTMGFFQYLFIAMTPLAAIMLVIYGANGIGYYGKYLLFGLWAHAFIIPATVINAYSVNVLKGKIYADGAGGAQAGLFSINGFDDFYNHVTSALTVANQALGYSSLILFAVLTGGMYALTRLADAANMQDYHDEKQTAPGLMQPAAAAGMASPAALTSNVAQQYGDSEIARSGGETMAMGSVTISSDMGHSASYDQSELAQTRSAYNESLQDVQQQMLGASAKYSGTEQYQESMQGARQETAQLREQIEEDHKWFRELNDAQQTRVLASVAQNSGLGADGGVRMGSAGDSMMPSSGGGSLGYSQTAAASHEQSEAEVDKNVQALSTEIAKDTGLQQQLVSAFANSMIDAEVLDESASESVQEMEQAAQQYEESHQRADAYRETAAFSENIGSNLRIDGKTLENMASHHEGGMKGLHEALRAEVAQHPEVQAEVDDYIDKLDPASTEERIMGTLMKLSDMANDENGEHADAAGMALVGSAVAMSGTPIADEPERVHGVRDDVTGKLDESAESAAQRDEETHQGTADVGAGDGSVPSSSEQADRLAGGERAKEFEGSAAEGEQRAEDQKEVVGWKAEGENVTAGQVSGEASEAREQISSDILDRMADKYASDMYQISRAFHGTDGLPTEQAVNAVIEPLGEGESYRGRLEALDAEHQTRAVENFDTVKDAKPGIDDQMAALHAINNEDIQGEGFFPSVFDNIRGNDPEQAMERQQREMLLIDNMTQEERTEFFQDLHQAESPEARRAIERDLIDNPPQELLNRLDTRQDQ